MQEGLRRWSLHLWNSFCRHRPIDHQEVARGRRDLKRGFGVVLRDVYSTTVWSWPGASKPLFLQPLFLQVPPHVRFECGYLPQPFSDSYMRWGDMLVQAQEQHMTGLCSSKASRLQELWSHKTFNSLA